ncbi:MAG TPA: nucleotidyltransferase family protein [Rhizomicrobium sp.]|nr:nucleotidyltransferase family protein [Rhizomicrobium sp.]
MNDRPRVAAVVLAAGMSTRMGNNKLLADIHGQPLVRRVVGSIEASAARPIVVVTGHDDELVGAALRGTEAAIVHNPAYRDGLSTSLRAGISVLTECDAAIILLGDMPAISPFVIDKMIAAYEPKKRNAICVAASRGRRGNPVLFDRAFFPELQTISGDIGAREIIRMHWPLVCEVDVDDDGPLIDLDTPEELEQFLRRP